MSVTHSTDWTSAPGRGENTSDLYHRISIFVAEILVECERDLEAGEVERVARRIVANLAHMHRLTPQDSEPSKEPIVLEMYVRSNHLQETLEAIGNGMPGANEHELRIAALEALLWLAKRKAEWELPCLSSGLPKGT
jgi:hypothetical protein